MHSFFVSKECHSNGCAATVDVSYPSIPLFLLYNPELVRGMMRPVFKFARRNRHLSAVFHAEAQLQTVFYFS